MNAITKLIATIIGIAIGILIDAGFIWLLTWALVKIGITTIFGWTVAFSWPLVIVVIITSFFLKNIFNRSGKKED